jgi:hypothetical protein
MICKICNVDTFSLEGEGTGEFCYASVQVWASHDFSDEYKPHKFENL